MFRKRGCFIQRVTPPFAEQAPRGAVILLNARRGVPRSVLSRAARRCGARGAADTGAARGGPTPPTGRAGQVAGRSVWTGAQWSPVRAPASRRAPDVADHAQQHLLPSHPGTRRCLACRAAPHRHGRHVARLHEDVIAVAGRNASLPARWGPRCRPSQHAKRTGQTAGPFHMSRADRI